MIAEADVARYRDKGYIVVEGLVPPERLAALRAEVGTVVGDGPVTIQDVKRLGYVRNVFRETLRLYPPITFIPRVAAEKTRIGRFNVKKGAMIMVSPWTAHRNALLWSDPDRFRPERFDAGDDSGVLMSFGLGPRVCIGAAFATIESGLILARLARRYDFSVEAPERVRPVARLTTRPAEDIVVRVRRRERPA